MNPLFECYCSECCSLISGREYCFLGLPPIILYTLIILITIYIYILFKRK